MRLIAGGGGGGGGRTLVGIGGLVTIHPLLYHRKNL